MLRIMEQMDKFADAKIEVCALATLAENISRQLRGWLDSLQNSDIKGPRYLNDALREKYDRERRAEAFMDTVRKINAEQSTPKGLNQNSEASRARLNSPVRVLGFIFQISDLRFQIQTKLRPQNRSALEPPIQCGLHLHQPQPVVFPASHKIIITAPIKTGIATAGVNMLTTNPAPNKINPVAPDELPRQVLALPPPRHHRTP